MAKHLSVKPPVDCNPGLTPFERHLEFLKSRKGDLPQSVYFTLLKAHFPKVQILYPKLDRYNNPITT